MTMPMITDMLALTMSSIPIFAGLRGSGELDKIDRLVKIAVAFVLLWQLLIALVGVLLSSPIGYLLTNDDSVAAVLNDYLWRVPLSYGALGICMIMVSVANAMGKSMRALSISALRLLCCYLPCLWLGSQLGGLNGMFLGALVGNVAAGIMSWVMYQSSMSQLRQTMAADPDAVK